MFEGVEDKALIAELNFRGYRVAKSDRIRTASVASSHSTYELLRYGEEAGMKASIYRSLGARLGVFLLENGAVPVSLEMGDREMRSYRATATVVVDDPKFDWPYELRMGK